MLGSTVWCPGLSMVAQSRPQSKADFCYTAPVTLDRLSVCGTGKGANQLHAAEAAFAAQAEQSDALAFSQEDYEKLLHWAEQYAKDTHGIVPSWSRSTIQADHHAAGMMSALQLAEESDDEMGDAADECDLDVNFESDGDWDDTSNQCAVMEIVNDPTTTGALSTMSRFFAQQRGVLRMRSPSPEPPQDVTILRTEAVAAFEARRRRC